jgi:iron complex outermembrane receptor protein
MFKDSLKRVVVAAAFVISLAFAIQVWAVDASGSSASDEGSLQEVIVTARRVEERAQDVPISMTVFDQQQLTNHNVVTAADLAAYTPSLSIENFLGSTTTTFSLRGFTQDLGTEPTVGVYFADVPAMRAYSTQQSAGNGAGAGSFFDLQNVQVLKGPQGTLFGRNTTGGDILIVPQKPTAELGGYIQASFGDYGMKGVQAVVNVPFSDTVRMRLGVDHLDRDGYLENNTGIGPSDFNDLHYTAVRASLDVDVTPNIENYTVAAYSDSDQNGDLLKLVGANPATIPGALAQGQMSRYQPGYIACGADCRPYDVSSKDYFAVQNILPNANTTLEQWQVVNTTTWRVTDTFNAKNIISYGQLKENITSEVLSTAFDLHDLPGGLGSFFAPGTNVPLFDSVPVAGGHTAAQGTLTEEFRLYGNALSSKLDWQGGVYDEISDPLGQSGSMAGTLANCVAFQCNNLVNAPSLSYSENETSYRGLGLYGQASYHILDPLTFTAGYRYTWDSTEATGTQRQYSYPFSLSPTPLHDPLSFACTNPDAASLPDCALHAKQDSSAPTWLIELEYKPITDVMTYAKYARGYRTGGIVLQDPLEFQTFRPEKLDTYEIGAKTSFQGPMPGIFNVAAFYNDFSDQQVPLFLTPTSTAATPITGITNAGKSRIYGAEVEATVSLFRDLTVNAAYTYLNSRIQEFNIPAVMTPSYVVDPNQEQRVGDPLTYTPEHRVSVTPAYVLPLDARIGRITVSATYNYTGTQVANYSSRDAAGNLTGLSLLGSRNLLDLNFNWDKVANTSFSLAAFVTNVTDLRYYYNVTNNYSSEGFAMAGIGAPRMFGVRLRYDVGH